VKTANKNTLVNRAKSRNKFKNSLQCRIRKHIPLDFIQRAVAFYNQLIKHFLLLRTRVNDNAEVLMFFCCSQNGIFKREKTSAKCSTHYSHARNGEIHGSYRIHELRLRFHHVIQLFQYYFYRFNSTIYSISRLKTMPAPQDISHSHYVGIDFSDRQFEGSYDCQPTFSTLSSFLNSWHKYGQSKCYYTCCSLNYRRPIRSVCHDLPFHLNQDDQLNTIGRLLCS
jgi:hypothetical protein